MRRERVSRHLKYFWMANKLHEEEVLGKAYDSRLMRRLLTYLNPYKWQVAVALTAIVLKSLADVLGPFLTYVAIDKYLAPLARSEYHGHSPHIPGFIGSLFD